MAKMLKEDMVNRVADQPVFQAAIIFTFSALFALIGRIGDSLEVGKSEANAPWIMLTAGILFYAVCSSVLSLRTKHQNKYWRNGIFAFVGLAAASALLATAISGQSIDEAGSFRWLFVVLAIGYIVFLVIVRLIRRIVELAIKQDDKLRGE